MAGGGRRTISPRGRLTCSAAGGEGVWGPSPGSRGPSGDGCVPQPPMAPAVAATDRTVAATAFTAASYGEGHPRVLWT